MNNKTDGTIELQSQLALLNDSLYDEFEQMFHIPKEDLKSIGINQILGLVREIEERVNSMIAGEKVRVRGALDYQNATKKKNGKKVRTIPDTPSDILERVINTPIAEFLEWKFHDDMERRIVFRGINLLRTRLRFLIDYPNGISSPSSPLGNRDGGIDDPNVKADIKAHNARFLRPKFRS